MLDQIEAVESEQIWSQKRAFSIYIWSENLTTSQKKCSLSLEKALLF